MSWFRNDKLILGGVLLPRLPSRSSESEDKSLLIFLGPLWLLYEIVTDTKAYLEDLVVESDVSQPVYYFNALVVE